MHFSIGLPTVVCGPACEIDHADNSPSLALLFDIGEQTFALQVTLKADYDDASLIADEEQLYC